MKVRVIAEGYASMTIPERVAKLTILLNERSQEVSLNYAISFEPLTPSEFSEWYQDGQEPSSNSTTKDQAAAKDASL